MDSTQQPCPTPPECPAPWSSDGRVPQCGPHTWSPDLGMPLDRAASVSSAEQRWAKHADAPAVPQWQPPPPIRTHPRAQEQLLHAQQEEQHAQHAQQRPARYLPRAKSGPSQIGGWYTSTDMAAKWMRPAGKLARTSSADSARSSYEPQLVSPLRKPARTAQFQSSVRQARPAVAATTIRVVSSDWTPEGFEKTVGVFASRPQWSPLLRRAPMHDGASHEGAAMALASIGTLRTTSHPPAGSLISNEEPLQPSPVGPRSSWPPFAHTALYAGNWAARREEAAHEQPRSQPRGSATPVPAPLLAPLPPVPLPAPDRHGLSRAAQTPQVWSVC